MPPVVKKLLTFVVLAGAGLGVYAWLHATQPPPRQRPTNERGRAVRVLEVRRLEAIPRAVGYGVVRAQREWQGVAQAAGTIVEVAEGVEVGRVVQAGTTLFRVDPVSLELEISRSEAVVRAGQAQLAELEARESNARASLAVERRVLALARRERDRVKDLAARGLTSQSAVDAAERDVLNVERSIRTLQNTLAELPRSRDVMEAQLAQLEVGVDSAQMNLSRTEVVAPFTMRLRQVNAGLEQVVASGQVLVIGDSIDVMEVTAQVPVGAVGPLLPRRSDQLTSEGDASPTAEEAPPLLAPPSETLGEDEAPEEGSDSHEDAGEGPDEEDADAGEGVPAPESPPPAPPPLRPSPRSAAISAIVRLKTQGVEHTWEGRFRRYEGADPATRTMGVVIEIDDPRRRNGGTRRTGPPLSPGLHVEIELRGAARSDCLAVPRTAIHRDRLHVVGRGRRLTLRPVVVDIAQEDFVCIAEGLEEGEQVVLTSLSPAVEGMLLAPRPDDVAARWLAQVVGAEAAEP